jgi:hypothetical protein
MSALRLGLASVLAAASAFAAANQAGAPEAPTPSTPREFYNAGTQKLLQGKLREAEAFLESALASQVEKLQPPTLFNLGNVRFNQGVEELKKGPSAGPAGAGARRASQLADQAIRDADTALAGNDLDQLVGSYMHGRGVRKELKAATAAVRSALQAHRATLTRWQRASGDYKSVLELKQTDSDAQHNAEVVDRCIAKLVDSLRELQQSANGLGQKKSELDAKLQQLKGRIPAPNMPPGAAGDDEEDEDQPLGPKPGQQEGPTKDGDEMRLSPEQAGWLLDGFKLDGERRLPMGGMQPGEPKDRQRPTW